MGNYFSAETAEDALRKDESRKARYEKLMGTLQDESTEDSRDETSSMSGMDGQVEAEAVNESHSEVEQASETMQTQAQVQVEQAPAQEQQQERFMNLEHFDITNIGTHHNVAIIGRVGTGKTSLIRDIVYNNRAAIKTGRAYTVVTHDYRRYLPEYAVKPMFSEDEYARFNATLVERDMSRQSVVIYDDANIDGKAVKDVVRQIVFSNQRRLNIVAMQYPEDLIPAVRANIDYLFVFRNANINTRKTIHQQYFSRILSFEEFNQIMTQLSNYIPYTALVLDRRQDKMFWYRANMNIGQFKLNFE